MRHPKAAAPIWPYPHRTLAEIDAANAEPRRCAICAQLRATTCDFARCGLKEFA